MALSETTVSKLADAIKDEIIEHIYENDKFFDLMHELIAEALDAKMGEMDEDLYYELGLHLFDRIDLK